jgi:hypothetical protein
LETDPEAREKFNSGMAGMSGPIDEVIADAYDFPGGGTVVDVGGGRGGLLRSVLLRNPGLSGILYDQADTVREHLLDTEELAGRWRAEGGDFFTAVPKDGDFYLLKHILHDWNDADCVRILETIKRAAPPAATLLVIERVVAGPNEGADTKSSDLNMLVGPGGVERTADEFAALLAAGGWRLTGMHPAATHYMIEGVPS